MGGEALFDEVDPTAASVAAVHWLQAAVDVALPADGPLTALRSAAAGEGVGLAVADVVLRALDAGHPSLVIVQDLVRAARLAARGYVQMREAEGEPPHVTVLDPERPSRALLSDLTRTIQMCFMVFLDRCDPADVEGDGDWMELVRDRFDDLVRAEARRCPERLAVG
jgi:hypothetical protein